MGCIGINMNGVIVPQWGGIAADEGARVRGRERMGACTQSSGARGAVLQGQGFGGSTGLVHQEQCRLATPVYKDAKRLIRRCTERQ